ncbi:MAG: acyl-CoA dehydrogenase family protein [Pseudomonadales bacterium]
MSQARSDPAAVEVDALPVEGLLERVRAVVPLIADRAGNAERERKPDDGVIEALKATGVFRSFVPRAYGGYEIGMDLYVDVGILVSEACASTGWITTFYMEHNWLLGLFDESLQHEIFSAAPYILAPGSVNPKGGMAKRVAGGYELTGRWKFATGVVHADWVLISTMVETADEPVQRLCLVRPGDIRVEDTWHVDGMAATGSRDIVAEGVFVPEQRLSLLVPPVVTAGADATYLMRLPVRPFLSLTAAIPAVGAARRAVTLYRDLLGERVRFGTRKVQKESASAQIRLANTLTEARAAETVLRAAARQIERHAHGEIRLSGMAQQELGLAIAHVVRDCAGIVRRVMEGSGASVHFLDHPLQRINRDVQMMSAHTVFDVDLAAEQCGRARLEFDAPLFGTP